MEAIGLGDLHFDKLDSIIPEATTLICAAVEKALDYALDRGIKYVLFYGDICERPRLSYLSQVQFYKLLMKKRYRELEYHVVLGNHDFAEDGTHSLEVMEVFAELLNRNLKVYTKPTEVDLDGVPFRFLPYPHTSTAKGVVNVGHFEVAGSIRDNGRTIDEGPAKKHVTLMGHLHTNHRVRNTHYSGTLYQTNFGETEKKFFHHISAKSADSLKVKNVPFKSPWTLRNIEIRDRSDLEQLSDEKHMYYKLFIKDGVDIDINEVLDKYPNVVRHNVFKNKKDLELMIQQSWDFDTDVVDDLVNVDERLLVKQHLKSKGFKISEVKRGLRILKDVKHRASSTKSKDKADAG